MLSVTERLFIEEVREKKKAANGVHSKKGKRGYVGKMLFPFEMLRGKEKREYKKNGKVVSWNMYEDILEFEMFKGLTDKEKKSVLERLRDEHPNKKIMKKWGLNSQSYYDIVNGLGIKTQTYKNKNVNVRTLSVEEIKGYLKNTITYAELKTLVLSQQHFLLSEYLKNMTFDELGSSWDKSAKTIYNLNYSLNTKLKSNKFELYSLDQNEVLTTDDNQIELEIEDKDEVEDENVVENEVAASEDAPEDYVYIQSEKDEGNEGVLRYDVPDVRPTSGEERQDAHGVTETISQRAYGTTLSFDGEYTKEQLRNKLSTLVELLESDGRFYKMNISFTEINE